MSEKAKELEHCVFSLEFSWNFLQTNIGDRERKEGKLVIFILGISFLQNDSFNSIFINQIDQTFFLRDSGGFACLTRFEPTVSTNLSLAPDYLIRETKQRTRPLQFDYNCTGSFSTYVQYMDK